MNIPRLTELADCLEHPALPHDYNFNMAEWFALRGDKETNWCGTVCCIAGLTVLLFDPAIPPFHGSTMGRAQKLLDLDDYTADALFTPGTTLRYSLLTQPQAAQAVRNVIEGVLTPWEGL